MSRLKILDPSYVEIAEIADVLASDRMEIINSDNTLTFGKILFGTGFTAGTIEFAGVTTYSAQQLMSRRGLMMGFIAYLGGEALFSGLTISIIQHRGETTPKNLTAGRNISIISKSVNKRERDEAGNPIVSYECALINPMELALGDVVTLDYETLSIDISLRIVRITTNPYNRHEVSFEIGNYVNSLEDDLYRIETQSVKKDALMNGCRIGPENGFEAVRNDKKARAYFRSDGMALQSGDGSGTSWTDRLKYEHDSETGETTLVFNGKLSTTLISALSALVTPNFYAGTLPYLLGNTIGYGTPCKPR